MANYTNFYVDGAAGSDAYAGSGEAVVNRTNCDLTDNGGGSWNIEDMDSGGWGTAAVGQWVRWSVGVADVIVRITAVSGDNLTVNNPDSALSASTGKECNVGGAFATVGEALATVTPLDLNAADDPVAINIQVDSGYNETDLTFNTGWTVGNPLLVRGYDTTAGDLDPWTTYSRARIYGAVTSRVLYLNVPHVTLENLFFEITSSSTWKYALQWGSSGSYSRVVNCEAKALDSFGFGLSNSTSHVLIARCYVHDCGQGGFLGRIYSNGTIVGCVIRGNGFGSATYGGLGASVQAGGAILWNLVYNNKSDGLYGGGIQIVATVAGNIFADNYRHGLYDNYTTTAYPSNNLWANNIFAGNGNVGGAGYGLKSDFASSNYAAMPGLEFNAFHGNEDGARDMAGYNLELRHEITTQPFSETTRATRISSGDYTLDDLMKAVGYPGLLPVASGALPLTGYTDLGHLQYPSPAASGGETIYITGGGGGGSLIGGGLIG
jgi:hypothetical protein